MFDALSSGDAYLGFARSKPVWGLQALVSVEHNRRNYNFKDLVAGNSNISDARGENKYFDLSSLSDITGYNDFYREVFLAYTDGKDDFDMDSFTLIPNEEIALGADGKLYLNHINEYFCYIHNLSPKWYELIKNNTDDTRTRKYYILNYYKNETIAIKIMDKVYTEVPYYTFDCNLVFYINDDLTTRRTINRNGSGPLKKTVNILGETRINGLIESDVDVISLDFASKLDFKKMLLEDNTYFELVDLNGNIVIPRMKYANEFNISDSDDDRIFIENGNEKFLLLKYKNDKNEEVFVKTLIGSINYDDVGIWHEALPFESAANPVDDSNPPALDVTYLKNPMISSSIFDVNGLIKINPNQDVQFVKEMKTLEEKLKFESWGFATEETIMHGKESVHQGILKDTAQAGTKFIFLEDGHTFVLGDYTVIGSVNYIVGAVSYAFGNSYIKLNEELRTTLVWEPTLLIQSRMTNVIARITYAKTINKDLALRYGFTSAMISKQVDGGIGGSSPSSEIYRQLFICYKPKYWDETLGEIKYCYNDIYTKDNLFLSNDHKWDIGTLLYVAPKMPIYRKFLATAETFSILL